MKTQQRKTNKPVSRNSSPTIDDSSRRPLNMQIVVVLIGLVLVGRMFYLQVIKSGHYNALAIAEHQKKFTIPASRGTLYFRDNENVVPAVLNTKLYTLYGDPKIIKDVEVVATKLSAVLQLDKQKVKQLLADKNSSYEVLAKRLSKEQVDELFKDKKGLTGINVTPVPQRVYPEGQLGAQALGFVNDEGIGQYGIESSLNTKLAGQDGLLKATTDVNGVPLSLDDATNIAKLPKNGENMVLTLDRNIQAKAEEALATGLKKVNATKGSVIVMDPRTGAIKAMANLPTYDPTNYFDVGDDAYQRFQNRVVSSAYEAGSVMKVLTMATGLNEGVINKDSTFLNKGYVQVDDARIENVEQDVNGTRSMSDILKFSLNTGVVHILSQLGGGSINKQAREKFYSYNTERFGFGSPTKVEQSGEVDGTIFAPNSEQGNNVRYSNMAFGQGMNVTMVQVAAAFSSVVNGGNYFQPHLVEGTLGDNEEVNTKPPTPVRSDVVTPATGEAVRTMIRTALNTSPAVAGFVRPGYNVGGKTGTSQIIDQATGKYTENNAVGSYLGFGGDETPRYVIMVRVEDAKLGAKSFSGGAAAAPIFGDISNWLLDYYNIKPM
ncbi:penicillin-binding protein 2 [Candidatus Saccharibacteria bacterium]|jgi:cell division protein FtsI/penicillin-binding protein 2|nr:penicillin-binding protein 2 [Candidatus Saccharibacteria bacterium]